MQDLIMIHDPAYEGWIFDPKHPTQGRRFTKGHEAITMRALERGLFFETWTPTMPHRTDLETVHTPEYIDRVINDHECGEWEGKRPDMAHLAQLFTGGTLLGFDLLESRETLTAVHLPGAKHHAMADRSSGFCVFADFAIAATQAARMGKFVAILDIDVHHGDGTEALTADNPQILTYSIHQWGIFPGTGLTNDRDRHVYNWPLSSGDGDRHLNMAVTDFIDTAREFMPDYVFIAGGADGHVLDPLGSLRYTLNGYEAATRKIRDAFPKTPILFGGAGGYQPDGATPLSWASMVMGLVD